MKSFLSFMVIEKYFRFYVFKWALQTVGFKINQKSSALIVMYLNNFLEIIFDTN